MSRKSDAEGRMTQSLMPEAIALLRNDEEAPFLGSRETLNSIARNFINEASELRAMVGEWPEAKINDELDKLYAKNIDILLGRNSLYGPVATWNKEGGGISRNVVRRFGLTGPEDDIMKAQLALILQDYLQAEELASAGEDFEHVIDGAIELHTAVWLGSDAYEFPDR